MPKGFRGLRFEHTFEADFQALESDPLIRDEIMLGVEMVLCRKPESGFTEGHGVWIKEVSDPSRKRRFQIYYTFNDETVFLLSISRMERFGIWPE